MFWDDVQLVSEMVAKYSARPPYVEAGGIEFPTIAAYEKTIEAMAKLRWLQTHEPDGRVKYAECIDELSEHDVREAQMCRYLRIHRPLEAACPGYLLEDPATGGLPLERLSEKYDPARGTGIGTAILLSVLEHVDDPFAAIDALREAMVLGGLVIVSVPFQFPEHAGGGQDCWRFTPTALRHVFSPARGSEHPPVWSICETDWRLRIDAGQGVLDIHTGKPQAIESCFLVARAC